MSYKESYTPVVIGVNSSIRTTVTQLGAFIATTAGTITIVDGGNQTLLNAHPVAAGQYLPLPIFMNSRGGAPTVVTTAGGASGLLLT